MVMSPGDLYDILSDPRHDVEMYDGLGNFAERADELNLPAVNPPLPTFQPWPAIRLRLEDSHQQFSRFDDKTTALTTAAGLTLAAMVLDKPMNDAIGKRQNLRLLRSWKHIGDAAPSPRSVWRAALSPSVMSD